MMTRFLLLLAVLLLVWPAVSIAAVPSAVEAPDLEPRVHSPTPVYCGQGTDWTRAEFGASVDVAGYALLAERAAVLSPDICSILRGPLLVNDQWAAAVLALLHELSHVWWQNPDESATDCFALFIFRWEARHSFGLSAAQAQRAYDGAWRVHQAEAPQYKGCAVYMATDPLAAY
jgi:hypothetical protein